MKNNAHLCEACQKVSFLFKETHNGEKSESPYYLCDGCYKKLISLSLRPIEVYNLAAIHGYSYYLHDDFYDDDGAASQPEEEFTISKDDYAPKLSDIKNNLLELVKYCTTKWIFSDELKNEFSRYDNDEILSACKQKYESAKGFDVKVRILEIASLFRSNGFCLWINELWNKNELSTLELSSASIKPTDEAFLTIYKSYTTKDIKNKISDTLNAIKNRTEDAFDKGFMDQEENDIVYLLQAMLNVLPFDESFEIVRVILSKISKKQFPMVAYYTLCETHSSKILDWMEEVVISYNDFWPKLVASSAPIWSYIKKWLSGGRPLSLVAIESISLCSSTGKLNIEGCPEWRVVEETILTYEKCDNVPRVNNAISRIKSNVINHKK